MATNSSTFAWRIPGSEELGRITVHRVTKSQIQLKRLKHQQETEKNQKFLIVKIYEVTAKFQDKYIKI